MFGLTNSVGKRPMPTGLREIESSFKQVQKDYQSYAKRRQVLAIEVQNCHILAAVLCVGRHCDLLQ